MQQKKAHQKTLARALLPVAIIALTTSAVASADLFEDADRAARESRLSDMQAIYEQILQTDPANVRALTGKAAAQAWQQDFPGAQATYRRAIDLSPENLDARVGLGYAYAWGGEYTKAHTSFNTALRSDPYNLSARKGIGYSYLWSGEYELALDSFELASSIAPADAEIAEASGHASLSLGHARDAINGYERALQYDPHRDSAKLGRRAAFTTAPALEVSAQYGSTSDAESGVRSVEIAHWPSLSTRLAIRYDNSLSLDNRAIAERGEDAPGYYVGAQQSISERWLAVVEFGRRQLSDGDQSVVNIATAVRTGVGTLKLGAQLGRHDAGYTDQLLFGGIAFPLLEVWRIEPVLFVSEFGTSRDNEWRVVLNTTYQSSARWDAGLRIGGGQVDASDPGFTGRTSLYGAWASVFITDQVVLNFSVQREETPTEHFDIALLGITYRLPRN